MRSYRSGLASLRRALAWPIARRSLFIALAVGTVLNLINQGDALVEGAQLVWLKIILTYAVPFCVATYGAYCVFRSNVEAAGDT